MTISVCNHRCISIIHCFVRSIILLGIQIYFFNPETCPGKNTCYCNCVSGRYAGYSSIVCCLAATDNCITSIERRRTGCIVIPVISILILQVIITVCIWHQDIILVGKLNAETECIIYIDIIFDFFRNLKLTAVDCRTVIGKYYQWSAGYSSFARCYISGLISDFHFIDKYLIIFLTLYTNLPYYILSVFLKS